MVLFLEKLRRSRAGRRLVVQAAVLATLMNSVAPAMAGFPFHETTTIHRLAKQIDKLERHIDEYGTVTAKTPDVWGEARLTKYRREYEKQLQERLDDFQVTINAAISRTDQAFLANSFALQAAISGPQAFQTLPSETVSTTSGQTIKYDGLTPLPPVLDPQVTKVTEGETTSAITVPTAPTEPQLTKASFDTFTKTTPGFAGDPKVALEPVIGLDQLSRYLNHLQQLRRINDGDDQSDYPGYSLNLVRIPFSVLPGKKTREGYGAEVTVMAKPHLHEELLPKTFRHLVVNDVVDELSFPLTKIVDLKNAKELIEQMQKGRCDGLSESEVTGYKNQIAVIKKKLEEIDQKKLESQIAETKAESDRNLAEQAAIGAESAIARASAAIKQLETLERQLTDDLAAQQSRLPTVLNMARELPPKNASQVRDLLRGQLDATGINKLQMELEKASEIQPLPPDPAPKNALEQPKVASEVATPNAAEAQAPKVIQEALSLHTTIQTTEDRLRELKQKLTQQEQLLATSTNRVRTAMEQKSDAERQWRAAQIELQSLQKDKEQTLQELEIATDPELLKKELAKLEELLKTVGIGMSIAPSRRAELPFPPSQLKEVIGCVELGHIAGFLSGLKAEPTNAKQVLLLDVQKSLTAESEAAYEMLVRHPELWAYCTDELLCAIRTQDRCTVCRLRSEFIQCASACNTLRNEVRSALAWAIIVESTLLNQRLIDDIKHLTAAKNAPLMNPDGMIFYGPDPDPIARATFNQYVQCRWPIHVVALDPVTQDQNVADRFSMQREMQLAMSLAFATGNMSAQNFMKYARKISLDMETVDLNRTAVAFSHGDDTFGWRFMPRVQSPDIEGNCRVLFKDLIHGGRPRDYDLCQRRLEPGPRECTAIVIMPSFVPYVIFDVRSNWFKLTNPKHKEMTTESAVKLSADVMSMRQLAQECQRDAAKYRDDEAYRLCRAVDSLERRLPLQSTYVPMPFDNSLGGFEFFNSGIPDLAPELHGFYGEPGIVVDHSAAIPATRPDLSVVQTSGATLFLVGDKFSTHDSQVIAGNRDVTDYCTILSRQIMKVSIPACALTIQSSKEGSLPVVDVHLATSYGISNHLEIPIIASPQAAAAAKKAADEVTAAAKKVVDEALGQHLQAKHVDNFVWRADEPRATMTSDANGIVSDFQLASPIAIQNDRENPFAAKTAELRCIVAIKRKDKAAKALPLSTGSVIVDFNNSDRIEKFATAGLSALFENSVREALVTQRVDAADIEQVLLDGYLRFFDRDSGSDALSDHGDGTGHRDGQPIVHVGSPLPIKVTVIACNGQPMPAAEPIPTPPAPSLPSAGTGGSIGSTAAAAPRMPAALRDRRPLLSPPENARWQPPEIPAPSEELLLPAPPSRYADLPSPPSSRPVLPAVR